jgi:hypothetical protein
MGFGFKFGLSNSIFNGDGARYDSSSQAYFNAFGDLPTPYKEAVNRLVLDLKSNSLWTKLKFGVLSAVTLDDTKTVTDLKTGTILTTGALQGNGTTGDRTSMVCPLPQGFWFKNNDYINSGANVSTVHTLNDSCIVHSILETTPAASQNAWGATENASAAYVLTPRGGSNTLTQRWYTQTNNAGSNTISSITSTNGRWISSRRSATDAEIYLDNTSKGTFANGGGSLPNLVMYIGAQNNASVAGNHFAHICPYHLWFSGLSDAEVSTLNTILTTYETNALIASFTRKIVFDGNSLMQYDNYGTMRKCLYYAFADGKAYLARNYSVGGQTLADMIADYASQVAPQYDGAKAQNIYVMFEGRNDLYFGASIATVKANYESLRDLALATGFKVVIPTITATKWEGNTGRSETQYNLDVDEINIWLRTLATATVKIVDLNLVGLNVPRANYASDAAYNTAIDAVQALYTLDGTHFNPEGNRLCGKAIYDQALDLIG